MRFNGSWDEIDDGVVRPVMKVLLLDTDGRLFQAHLVVDSGADRTVLDYRVLDRLGVESVPAGFALAGIGGDSPAVSVDAAMFLIRSDGAKIRLGGPFLASADPTGLDFSLLGRDALDNFAVVIDRPGGVVALLSGHDPYTIRQG